MELMNREQRRKMQKKEKIAKRMSFKELARFTNKHDPFHAEAANWVVRVSEPHKEGELVDRCLRAWAAFERLKDGSADTEDFDRICMGLNIAHVRAEAIDKELDIPIKKAHRALNRCKARFLETGKFGFSKTDAEVMAEAIEIQQAIEDKSSPKQLSDALAEAYARIKQQQKGNHASR